MIVESVLHGLHYFKPRVDGDFVDEISQVFTANLLLMLSMATSVKTFTGRPIECLVPNLFHYALEEYSEAYCWVKDTYFLPWDEEPPSSLERRDALRISYYQWVPFFLLIQSVTFRLPGFIWKWSASHSGMNIHDYINLATDPLNTLLDTRKLNVANVAHHIDSCLRFHNRSCKKKYLPHFRCFFWLNLPYMSNYVTILYLTSKIMQLANVLLQMIILNVFLSSNEFKFMGWQTVYDMTKGSMWEHSGMFPRVTICDLELRDVGQAQRYSFQCSLIINMLNEKIFIFLWLWYTGLLALTSINLVQWIVLIAIPRFSISYIKKHLWSSDLGATKESKRLRKRFMKRYLRCDAILAIRLITAQAGVIFGSELVEQLWRQYFKLKQKRRTESAVHPGIEGEESEVDRKLSMLLTPEITLTGPEESGTKMSRTDSDSSESGDRVAPISPMSPSVLGLSGTSAALFRTERIPSMLLTDNENLPVDRMERRVRLMERGHYTTPGRNVDAQRHHQQRNNRK